MGKEFVVNSLEDMCALMCDNNTEGLEVIDTSNKTYCTECPYFTDAIYEDEQWYGARCKKDGHSTMPSMYAIKSLHDSCPLTAESEE